MAHDILISAERIEARVDELAAQIARDYRDVEELVMIGVLKGAFMFLADLARKLTVPHRIEFISVSSYGEAGDEAGAVRLLMDVRTTLAGKHVLLVEDIVDTGRTIEYLLRLLNARSPASLRTCALVRKPDRLEVEVPIDYLGFEIPDVWVVGYGLDFAERNRTLPYIAELTSDQ
jgi:hypoxanthine phosphoribosyltransferase